MELLKFAVPDDETCYRRRDISTTVISRVAGGYGRTQARAVQKLEWRRLRERYGDNLSDEEREPGSGERETPRRKAVASGRLEGCVLVMVAASVRLHGARPWHLEEVEGCVLVIGSGER